MKPVLRIIICSLLLIVHQTSQANDGQLKLDSLLNEYNSNPALILNDDFFNSINTLCKRKFTSQCEDFYCDAITYAEKKEVRKSQIFRLKYITSLINSGQYSMAEQQIKINKEATVDSDLEIYSQSLILDGWLKNLTGNYSGALREYLKALEIKKSIKDNKGILNSYNRLSLLFRNQGNYETSKYFAKKILEIGRNSNRSSLISYASTRLAFCYILQDSLAKADSIFTKGHINENENENFELLKANWFLANNNIVRAESNFINYKIKSEKDKRFLNVYRFQLQLIRKFIELKNYEKANYYFNDLEKYPINEYLIENYEKEKLRIILESQNRNPQIDLTQQNSLIALFDRNIKNQRQNTVKLMELLMEKEGYINKLNETIAENKINKKTINEQFAGFVMLLIFSGLLSMLYLKNKRESSKNVILIEKIKQSNEVLENNINEKSFLLKEIHHRVKNNLQTLSSLLNLQSHHISDKTSIEALQSSINRVQSIALIHQYLYEKDHLDEVPVKRYIPSLIKNLIDFFEYEDAQVQVTYDLDPILLNIDIMNSFGLLINELIINSLKYGFSFNKKDNALYVSLKNINGQLKLQIKDNGNGFDKNNTKDNFGMFLVKTLTDKLEGTLEINSENGTHTIITFNNIKFNING